MLLVLEMQLYRCDTLFGIQKEGGIALGKSTGKGIFWPISPGYLDSNKCLDAVSPYLTAYISHFQGKAPPGERWPRRLPPGLPVSHARKSTTSTYSYSNCPRLGDRLPT
jgi:hypothetical protein